MCLAFQGGHSSAKAWAQVCVRSEGHDDRLLGGAATKGLPAIIGHLSSRVKQGQLDSRGLKGRGCGVPWGCTASGLEVGTRPPAAWLQTSRAEGTSQQPGYRPRQLPMHSMPSRELLPLPSLWSRAGTLLALGSSHPSTGPPCPVPRPWATPLVPWLRVGQGGLDLRALCVAVTKQRDTEMGQQSLLFQVS